eukprot:scaffold23161_cov55-Attheya_sp.AAC.7
MTHHVVNLMSRSRSRRLTAPPPPQSQMTMTVTTSNSVASRPSRSSTTVRSGGVCVVASWRVAGTAWCVTDGVDLKRVARVRIRLATAVAKVVGFEGLY